MSNLPYEIVNAFTKSETGGNPAAVVLLDSAKDSRASDSSWKQRLATDFNLSETAFPVPLDADTAGKTSRGARFNLKWFTPTTEVDLCGHATLASSHVIFSRDPELQEIHFETLSGELIVKRASADSYAMDFPAPALDAEYEKEEIDSRTREALEVIEGAVKSPSNIRERIVLDAKGHLSIGKEGFVIEFDDSVNLEDYQVDTEILAELKWPPMMMFTQARNENACDIASRVFCPNYGIPEDPVTGSAHCIIAPYWLGTEARKRLTRSSVAQGGQDRLLAKQVSSRVGELDLVWDKANGRISIIGSAVTTQKGEVK